MITINIKKNQYEQIKHFPLFFFNKIEGMDHYGHRYFYWKPESIYAYKDNSNRIIQDELDTNNKHIWFAFGKLSTKQPEKDFIRLELESFYYRNPDHIKAVLMIFIKKASNQDDKYAIKEFLWMLNTYPLDMSLLSRVIETFDRQSIQPFLWKALMSHAKCLSIPKQKIIKQLPQLPFLSKRNIYNIYIPNALLDALKLCYPNIDFSNEDVSIFELVHHAVLSHKYKDIELNPNAISQDHPTNLFLQIRKWLTISEYHFNNFEELSNIFRLFSPKAQLLLVRRYFHAVRLGQTHFNQDILKTFHFNKYENWGVYYHCAHEASKPINLTVPLLCDNILTFMNSNQSAFQTVNGTLDMAYAKCDINSPDIDFGLMHIFPICNGGAVPNTSKFVGFIRYKIVYVLNESIFQSESIINVFTKCLNIYGHQQSEQSYICEETLQENESSKGIETLNKYSIRFDNEKDDFKSKILRFFTDIHLPYNSNVIIIPNKDILDIKIIKERITSWLNENLEFVPSVSTCYETGENIQFPSGWTRGKLKNMDSCYDLIISEFLTPQWCSIEPRENVYIGRGVLNNETRKVRDKSNDNSAQSLDDKEIQEKEHSIIAPCILESLREVLKVSPDRSGRFIVKYDDELLWNVKTQFYTFNETENSDNLYPENFRFLTIDFSKYARYCAPKYNNDINRVTQLPFMWCRGKECFKNTLENQTLDLCKSWRQYSFLHIMEILGYPQVYKTSGGNETSELIRGFIAMVNNSSSLFSRAICRECSHILFPIGSSNFNRYNNFECRVPYCENRYKRIYLSNCHKCKTGLIDSRETAKCPNGWYICPKCLSCCDDEIYEKMARKYVLRGEAIPTRISDKLKHGHNDRDKHFCPKCGKDVIAKTKNNNIDRIEHICESCGTTYRIFYKNKL